MDKPNALFVSGALRSGTSLLEKLLCNHPSVSVLSQPCPQLFVAIKRAFLESLGYVDERWPLGNLFLEDRYDLEDFEQYLQSHLIDAESLTAMFERSFHYSGSYTKLDPKAVRNFIDSVAPATVGEVLSQLYQTFAHRPGAKMFGAKETTSEEFIPYLVTNGFAVVQVVRDPRDVLASLNYGRGSDYGGRRKPTLFNVRSWRKSVAIALHMERVHRFIWMRYEDLVTDTGDQLNRVSRRLGLEPFSESMFANGLRDQSGMVWMSNSSHSQQSHVSQDSIGTYARLVPEPIVRFVEATCLPELRALGYSCALDAADAKDVIRSYREADVLERAELRDYLDHDARRAEEIRRLELWYEAPDDVARRFFLFNDVYMRLGHGATRHRDCE